MLLHTVVVKSSLCGKAFTKALRYRLRESCCQQLAVRLWSFSYLFHLLSFISFPVTFAYQSVPLIFGKQNHCLFWLLTVDSSFKSTHFQCQEATLNPSCLRVANVTRSYTYMHKPVEKLSGAVWGSVSRTLQHAHYACIYVFKYTEKLKTYNF